MKLALIFSLFSSITFDLSISQSIPVGGAYIGCVYDVLVGNPEGASFKNGGLDPGLKPAKFVLMKTFTSKSGYCPEEATCVEIGGTFAEETYSLNADLAQYRSDFSSLWSSGSEGSILIASFGGTLSGSYKEAKDIISDQQKVVLNKRRVTITGSAVYNTRRNRRLNPEFLESLCELPLEYSQREYMTWIKEWGTDVIIGAKLGVRESVREEFSKKVIINSLQRNQSAVVNQKAGFLTVVSSSLTGEISSQLVDDLRKGQQSLGRWVSAVGSPVAPAPLNIDLRSIDRFITPEALVNETLSCSSLRIAENVRKLQGNIGQALTDYPAFVGAETPKTIIRELKMTWPAGTYTLLMGNEGCPDGYWANGSRYQDTIDWYPNNKWSEGFKNATAMTIWRNNLDWRFCTKLIEFDADVLDWPRGGYCVFKKGPCPLGFDMGSVFFDDEGFANANDFEGTLPEGEYTGNTRFYFCCRDDGTVNRPIFLPTAKPFLLLPVGPACQTVAGMQSTLHWLRVDTKWNGWSVMTGKHAYATKESTLKFTIFFCYYKADSNEVPIGPRRNETISDNTVS